MSNADEKQPEFAREPPEPPTILSTTAPSSRGGGGEEKSATNSSASATASRTAIVSRLRTWLPVNVGAGIVRDIRARAPWYWSDWTDAWNYRVLPATTLILFANVLPGIAFSLHLTVVTGQYGVSEVLLSSFMASFVFSVFGAQPLCIAGVTGPISVLNQTIFKILEGRTDSPDYLHFIGWVYLWGAIFHWITAALNWCNFLQYVTLFSCEAFGFYVAWTYLQFGIQVLTHQFDDPASSPAGALTSTILAFLMLVTAFLFKCLSRSVLFHRHVRRFCADYGMPLALVASSAIAYWGSFHTARPLTLPVGPAFQPSHGRSWLVRFWRLDGKWVALAFPFGILLWVLFFFDHNVSSLIAQGSQFPLRKPAGFHYDFALLGVTTFLAGLLGVPAPNGLIPQAPIHTRALVVHGLAPKATDNEELRDGINEQPREVPVAVVEQRVSNLAQGSLCLVLLTGPFLHVLNLVPQGLKNRGASFVFSWYMGLDELSGNGITLKILYFLTDRTLTPSSEPLRRVRKSRVLLFVALQLVAFGATFAITQTIAAVGFPVIILLLIPLRTLIVPRMSFSSEELGILDRPTASPFTMQSVSGF
ncbi:HCO3 transporter family-domain-containing protein [Lactarius akahatsu]|uniref:HCO3 transporter family-domain-containing protein n=1 Tax=Lactarius akahatsu TaxID=416441 RepID=A0AAD4L535_9AGAM|nr:HCO3 transporter family-domain-containing protein [Lactarius akahatsu]